MIKTGIIYKGVGGLYSVKADGMLYDCRAKGKFRHQQLKPVVGDKVDISVNDNADNTVDLIYERKNLLRRPPVANIDILFIVVSTCEPVPSTLVIDRLTVICEKNNIKPVIVLSKGDLKSTDELTRIYSKTGYLVILNTDLDCIKDLIQGRLCAFTGNSGVGKSTLLNTLCPALELKTAEISLKLGRGKHTTRHAEIFEICDGLVIDTAGFSSLDFGSDEYIEEDELQFYFPEFNDHITKCRFTGCSHTVDKDCEILRLVNDGEISKSRHESYSYLYKEAKDRKRF